MDGTDMQRRLAAAQRQARRRAEWEQLRRDQRPPQAGTAAECRDAARNRELRFEPMRRALGGQVGIRTRPTR
jgi:hypothetical protein